MYDAYHEVIVANNADALLDSEYTVTGPILRNRGYPCT